MQRSLTPLSLFVFLAAIVFLFQTGLMVSFVGGLVLFLATHAIHDKLSAHIHSDWTRKATALCIAVLVGLLLTGAGFGIYSALHFGQQNAFTLSNEAATVLQQLKSYLPSALVAYVPDDLFELKNKVAELLKHKSSDLLHLSMSSLSFFAHILLGFFLGALVAFHHLSHSADGHTSTHPASAFRQAFIDRLSLFSSFFSRVIGAQVKISLVNTVFTALFLLVLLPLLHQPIPYAKTLVALTFLCGLFPVVGNLISNTLITLIALTVSFETAVICLGFLVIVHKLEYYINAQIVGDKIAVSIHELLIAMVLFKTLFGVIGLVLAPVLYGYLKEELQRLKWI
jgi:predicted PurR-regulated permease PerM